MCLDAMRDAIDYIRVSSKEQVDSGLGLEGQSLEKREASFQGRRPNHVAGLERWRSQHAANVVADFE